MNTAAERNEVKAKLAKIKSEVTKDWTFHPQISETSKSLVGMRASHPLYERQMEAQRLLEEQLLRKKEEQEQQRLREATFAPQLPESSKELAKKKLSMGQMDTSNDVYSRLTTSHSPHATLQDASVTSSTMNANNLSRSIILPEKVLSQVFNRLATPSVQQMEEYANQPETKKIVVPEHEAEQIFNRLSTKKTMIFTFKSQEHEMNRSQVISTLRRIDIP